MYEPSKTFQVFEDAIRPANLKKGYDIKKSKQEEDEINKLVHEKVNVKEKVDPFKGIDNKTQKVSISKNCDYESTSQNDIY